jgi:hypothetical protein
MNRTMDIWTVKAGALVRHYFTAHHAEQMADALRQHKALASVTVTVERRSVPRDALSMLAIT